MGRYTRLSLVIAVLFSVSLCAATRRQGAAQRRFEARAAQPRIRSNSQVLGRGEESQIGAVRAALAFEGERLAEGARASDGRVARQSMEGFRGTWSGDAQLFWTPTQSGARLELTIRVNRAGDYGLAGYFTKAPDYGKFEVGAHGREIGSFDGYAARVERSGRISLGRVRLEAGKNQLIFAINGKARASTGYYVGIDRLELVSGGDAGRAQSVGPRRRPRVSPRRAEVDRRSESATASASMAEMRRGVEALEQELSRLSTGANWRRYLQLDELERVTGMRSSDLDSGSRQRLRAILKRFDATSRNPAYRAIAWQDGFRQVHSALRHAEAGNNGLRVDAQSPAGRRLPRSTTRVGSSGTIRARGSGAGIRPAGPLIMRARQPIAILPKGALLFQRNGDFRLTSDVEVSAQATDQSVSFSFDVSKVPHAGGALWQVSRVRFVPLTGGAVDRAPRGLVQSGTAEGKVSGFTVDFAALGSTSAAPVHPVEEAKDGAVKEPTGGGNRLFVLNPKQLGAFAGAGGAVSYYVRVIPMDSPDSGTMVGQPSNVMRVFHGKMPAHNDFRFHEEGLNPPRQAEAPRATEVTRFEYRPARTYCHAHTDKSNCGTYKGRNAGKKPWEEIADFVTDAWDWASDAYQSVKEKVIETVAAGLNAVLPVDVPESVLELALDSALVAAGIPPSIPNFEELMEENLDYMAELAVEEMNLPPGASELAKEKLKEGIRAGAQAARDAARGSGPGTPCDYRTDPPYFVVSLEHRGNSEYRDLRIDIANRLFDRREKTIAYLRPGQAVTVPVVLPRAQRQEFWDGQLYDEGAWWRAYNETAYECYVFIVTRNSPDYPEGYPKSLSSFAVPKRVWNTPLVQDVR